MESACFELGAIQNNLEVTEQTFYLKVYNQIFFFVPGENVTVSGFLLIRGVTPHTTQQNPNNTPYCLAKFLPKSVRREAKTSLPMTKALTAVTSSSF